MPESRSGSLARRGDPRSRQATRTEQPLVLGLDRCIAFAGSVAETLQIGDLDMAPAVADEIGLLQRVGYQRYAVAARADHLRHRFLRQNDLVAAGEIAGVQQTPRQPGF